MVVESPEDGAAMMRTLLTDDEESSGPLTRRHVARNGSAATRDRTDDSESVAERAEDDEEASDPIQFPQSTYSLLFTEPVLSLPFAFALAIAALSTACLGLAIWSDSGVISGSIPVRVDIPVKIAQFLSLIILLIMEEEIPCSIYLRRMIPEQSLHEKFPQINYKRFGYSSDLRELIGVWFLFCGMFVITHASGVIEIFYDILALQFVQQLDDIAFDLAKKDVMGKKLKRACTAKYFQAEFDKERRCRGKKSFRLKASYFVNLGWMLAWLVTISVKQFRGDYLQPASSITVNFGDTVWEKSWTRVPSWRPRKSPGESFEEWTLVYASFNGVYEMVEGSAFNSRPVYRERRKDDPESPFERTIPAEIKYCSEISAWVFTHDDIFKSKPGRKAKNQGCNWLLRSPKTEEFDLLNVIGDWEVWVGVIGKAEVSIASNECQDDSDGSDCNLNGQCIKERCECDTDEDVQYIGAQCEVILRDSCQTIIGESYNETFSVLKDDDRIFQEYSRPVFVYNGGHPDINDEGLLLFVYSGNRWFGTGFSAEEIAMGTEESRRSWWADYHAFWYQLYSERTIFVSDPTSGSTPVGADFYLIGERGGQFGPFGALYPLQLDGQTGRGYFRCNDTDSNPENALVPARKFEFQSCFGRKGVQSQLSIHVQ